MLAENQRVRIHGLVGRPDLNDRFGTVITPLDGERHGVAVDGRIIGGRLLESSMPGGKRERVRLRPANLEPVTGQFVVAIDHDRCLADLLREENIGLRPDLARGHTGLLPGLCEFISQKAAGRQVVLHSYSNRVSDMLNLCRKSAHFPTNLQALAPLCACVEQLGHSFEVHDAYLLSDVEVSEMLPSELREEYSELVPAARDAVERSQAAAPAMSKGLREAINGLQGSTALKQRLAETIRQRHAGVDTSFLFLDDKLENLRFLDGVPSVTAAWLWPTQVRTCRIGRWVPRVFEFREPPTWQRTVYLFAGSTMQQIASETFAVENWEQLTRTRVLSVAGSAGLVL